MSLFAAIPALVTTVSSAVAGELRRAGEVQLAVAEARSASAIERAGTRGLRSA